MNDTRLRIVVADNDQDAQEVLGEILTRLGHQVVAAVASGRQLVERAGTLRPGLVLTDVALPEMDGIEAARIISREAPAPVILMSASREVELPGRAVAASSVMAWLIKP